MILSGNLPPWRYFENHFFCSSFFLWVTSFSCYCNKHWPYILSSKYCSIQPYLLSHLCSYGGHFLFQNHTKNQILRCLKVYLYFHLSFFFHLFIDFALRDFCTFKELRPSVCIFNLTSASGKISVIICWQVNNLSTPWEISIITIYQMNTFIHFREICFHSWEILIVTFYQVNTIFHFRGTSFQFLGNLNYYLLPGKYPFPLLEELVSTSWESSIITFYQVNTIFHFRGTRFHFLRNLNYYLYQVNTLSHFRGNLFPLPGKSQLLPFTK